jgi:anti-anti-sigma regulatory factor
MSRRLTAQGALTELGGELTFAAVTSLLDVSVVHMTIDLSQLTTVEEAGLAWLHRAWLQVEEAGGYLWTVRVPERYRAQIPTSRPQLVVVDQNKHSPTAPTTSGTPAGRAP